MISTITAPGSTDTFKADQKFVQIMVNGTFGGSTATLEFRGSDGVWRPLVDDNGKHLFTTEASRVVLNVRPLELRLTFAGGTPNAVVHML